MKRVSVVSAVRGAAVTSLLIYSSLLCMLSGVSWRGSVWKLCVLGVSVVVLMFVVLMTVSVVVRPLRPRVLGNVRLWLLISCCLLCYMVVLWMRNLVGLLKCMMLDGGIAFLGHDRCVPSIVICGWCLLTALMRCTPLWKQCLMLRR